MLLLARSGLEVLAAFPKLYWNDHCPPGWGNQSGPRLTCGVSVLVGGV
jgi:hypothetical protein